MSAAAEARLAAARQALQEGQQAALLAALGITPEGTSAELWGPLLTHLLGGPDELAAIRWSVDFTRRRHLRPPLAQYLDDLTARLDAVHRFLREVAEAPAAEAPGRTRAARSADVLDCLACGATIAECDKVCRDSGLSRSCCPTCKRTATHTPAAHAARGRLPDA